MAALQTALLVLLAITSILLILMILLHKGRGGGVATCSVAVLPARCNLPVWLNATSTELRSFLVWSG